MSLRAFRPIAKTTAFLAFFVFTGCSGDEARVTSPDSESQAAAALLDAPEGTHHRANTEGDVLQWDPPAGSMPENVTGYNVYRYQPHPNRENSFQKVNEAPLSEPRLVMTNLSPGDAYWHRVSAINADGVEGSRTGTVSFVAQGPQEGGGGRLDQEVVEL